MEDAALQEEELEGKAPLLFVRENERAPVFVDLVVAHHVRTAAHHMDGGFSKRKHDLHIASRT